MMLTTVSEIFGFFAVLHIQSFVNILEIFRHSKIKKVDQIDEEQ
jgi:hypothetical protein